MAGSCQSIHHWHLNIHQDHIVGILLRQIKRDLAILGDINCQLNFT